MNMCSILVWHPKFAEDVEKYLWQITSLSSTSAGRAVMCLLGQVVVAILFVCVLVGRYFSFPFKSLLYRAV